METSTFSFVRPLLSNRRFMVTVCPGGTSTPGNSADIWIDRSGRFSKSSFFLVSAAIEAHPEKTRPNVTMTSSPQKRYDLVLLINFPPIKKDHVSFPLFENRNC